MGDALDHLDAGVILVDAAARILFANQTAEAIIAGNDGLGIDRDGVCAGSRRANPGSAPADRELRGRLARQRRTRRKHGDSARGRGAAPLRVVVAPFRADTAQIDTAWLGAARPVAILMVTDPEREQRVRKEDLRRRFGLTPAEADVALEILKGDGRDASAARLGIAATTVRAHLSHIFEKTGVRRQAELVRLLMQGERKLAGDAGGPQKTGGKLDT